MYPVLFDGFGLTITTYGVSKALAALAAWFLLVRAYRRLGWDTENVGNLVVFTTLVGFIGGKLYYLAEHPGTPLHHALSGAGFTWYGGFLAGLATFVVMTRREGLPLVPAAAAATAPLSLAYGIGRLGCLLAGDGTYGRPTDLPWGMTFPDAMVPTAVPVHPTPLYEALAAFAIAAVLWRLTLRRRGASDILATYLLLTGAARFLVEMVRINDPVVLGLTQPQLWSILLMAVGTALAGGAALRRRRGDAASPALEPATGDLIQHRTADLKRQAT